MSRQEARKPRKTKDITADEVESILAQHKQKGRGRIFSVTFVRRSDDGNRKLTGRFGVKAYLKGGERRYSDKKKKVKTVFDFGVLGYRAVPVDNIQSFRIDKVVYQVIDA